MLCRLYQDFGWLSWIKIAQIFQAYGQRKGECHGLMNQIRFIFLLTYKKSSEAVKCEEGWGGVPARDILLLRKFASWRSHVLNRVSCNLESNHFGFCCIRGVCALVCNIPVIALNRMLIRISYIGLNTGLFEVVRVLGSSLETPIQKHIKVVCLSCHHNRKCDDFTLFCRGRDGIVLNCVPHVQHAYFSSFN